jgi:hypothetical protein
MLAILLEIARVCLTAMHGAVWVLHDRALLRPASFVQAGLVGITVESKLSNSKYRGTLYIYIYINSSRGHCGTSLLSLNLHDKAVHCDPSLIVNALAPTAIHIWSCVYSN